MSVLFKIGETSADCELLIDGENILPKLRATAIDIHVTGKARQHTDVTIKLTACPVAAELNPDQLIHALREEADRIEEGNRHAN
jgi:hypothetical protein